MRRAVLFPVAACAVLAWASPASSQDEPRVTAFVTEQRVYLGETTRLRISVHGVRQAEAPSEDAFGKDLAVRFIGGTDVSQESFRIENGREYRDFVQAYVMDFEVRPLRDGVVVVPSVEIRAGGETLATEAVELTVIGPSASRNAQVAVTLAREWVYVEQELRVALRVRVRKARLDEGGAFDGNPWSYRDPPRLSIPWFQTLDGFDAPDTDRWIRGLIDEREGFLVNGLMERTVFSSGSPIRFRLARTDRAIDGGSWFEYGLAKRMIPTRVGTFAIPTTTLRGEIITGVSSNGRTFTATDSEEVFVAHESLEVEVRPVPSKGRPPTYSHAVGLYEAFAILDPVRGKVGDPMQLTLTVQGSGLLGNVTAPRLAQQADLARDFAVTESSEPSETDGGTKTFHYVVRPRRAEVDELPPLEFAFFDPRTEEFAVARTAPIDVEIEENVAVGASEIVQSGGGADAVSTPGEEVAGGLLGNAALEDTLADERVRPLASPLLLALLFLPPLALVGAVVAALRARRRSGDPLALRERNAPATARSALEEAAGHLAAGDEAQAVAALQRALAGYVADRSRRPSAGMTAADVRERFAASGVRSAAAEALAEALEACEAARYGGASARIAERVSAAAEWIAELETERLR